MSHRRDEKQARRDERLRHEAAARGAEARHRVTRWAGFAVVGLVAAALVTLAVVLGGGGKQVPATDPMGESTAGTAVVGAMAPDFALTDAVSGRTVSLATLKGRKTMLFFSEGVSCQACLVQAADLQKNAALRQAGIQLVSVTTDRPGDLATAAKQYGITTPLLADPTTSMSMAYGMLGHGGMGHATQDGHGFILLGADGRVLWHQAYQEMYVKPQELVQDMRKAVQA